MMNVRAGGSHAVLSIGRGGAVRDPRNPSLLDFGRRSAAARFSGGVKSFGVPARVTGDCSRPTVHTWPGGGQARRRAIFIHPCPPVLRQAAGAARPVPLLPTARHRTLIGGAA